MCSAQQALVLASNKLYLGATSYLDVHAHLAKLLRLQEEVGKLTPHRMEAEAHVTELEDLLNSNLLKRQQELTKRLQQADVEADRSVWPPLTCTSCQAALHVLHVYPCPAGCDTAVCSSTCMLKLFLSAFCLPRHACC